MFKLDYQDKEYAVRFTYTGKITWCGVTVEGVEYVAVSKCSDKDQFRKADGRKLALARALKDFDKDVRTVIWGRYGEMANW
jgi:hypothetical protein